MLLQTSEKLDSLNEKLIQLNLTAVQQNKLLLEKNSFSSSLSISKETDEIVNSVFEETSKLVLCPYCSEIGVEKFCDGEVGLKIHGRGTYNSKYFIACSNRSIYFLAIQFIQYK